MKRIAVIGAGDAGCFCAAELRRLRPDIRVDVYEAGPKALAKVAVTGGGRCNLTNSFESIRSLAEAFGCTPRQLAFCASRIAGCLEKIGGITSDEDL